MCRVKFCLREERAGPPTGLTVSPTYTISYFVILEYQTLVICSLKPGGYLNPTLNAVLTTQKNNLFSVTKTHRIMLLKEIIFIYETQCQKIHVLW
jgi:hypothetical protein